MEKKSGKKEKQIEIAKKMLKRGINIQDIKEITGLSLQEIEQLNNH